MVMVAIILAAGKGTRLGEATKKTPKPLVRIGDTPVIVYQIKLLRSHNIRDIYILTDYLEDQFPLTLGSGKKWDVTLHFVHVDSSLGPAGVLTTLQNTISDDFLLFYGDVMVNFDVQRLIEFHKSKRALLTLVTHPNLHPQDSDLLDTDQNDKVIKWYPKPHPRGQYRNLVNAGVYALSPAIFSYLPRFEYSDLGRDLLPILIEQKNQVYSYLSCEYFHDMGTPDRLALVTADVLSGKFSRLHGMHKRKAVFLDRDGVLIDLVDQLHRKRDVKLTPSAAKAVQLINHSEFLAITITNQPMFARGLLTYSKWRKIQNKIDTLLAAHVAKLDAVYYCPHHPDVYPGNTKKYNITCDCRKPATGMLQRAIHDFNIDTSNSFFVGDSTTDICTAQNMGIQSILVRTGLAGKDGKFDVKPTFTEQDILGAIQKILSL